MITRTSTEIVSDWIDNSTNTELTHFDATKNVEAFVETVFWISIIVIGTLSIMFWVWTIFNVMMDCYKTDSASLYRVIKYFCEIQFVSKKALSNVGSKTQSKWKFKCLMNILIYVRRGQYKRNESFFQQDFITFLIDSEEIHKTMQ